MLKIDENLNNNKEKQNKLIKFEIFRLEFQYFVTENSQKLLKFQKKH